MAAALQINFALWGMLICAILGIGLQTTRGFAMADESVTAQYRQSRLPD